MEKCQVFEEEFNSLLLWIVLISILKLILLVNLDIKFINFIIREFKRC